MVHHKHIKVNTDGRDFVMGDLHGCYEVMMKALKKINFDKEKDRILSVGDLVDRGPDSLKCLKLLREPWFFCVRGNHEDMMINALLHNGDLMLWVYNGGKWHYDEDAETLKGYAKWIEANVPLCMTVMTKDDKAVGICHAETPTDNWTDAKNYNNQLSEGNKHDMIWGRYLIKGRGYEMVKNVDRVYHGHTPTKIPLSIGNMNWIDTGAFATDIITLVEI